MKCVFCGSELPNGKDKCEYCGKFQHDFVKEGEVKQGAFEVEQKEPISIGKIILAFVKITFIVAIVSIAGYFVLYYLKNSTSFYGSWRCTTEENTITNITFEKKIVKIKSGSSGYIEADYMVEREVKEDDNLRFYLDVSSSKRLANGQGYVDSNETKFEIEMSTENDRELTLKNTDTGATYKCYIDKQ